MSSETSAASSAPQKVGKPCCGGFLTFLILGAVAGGLFQEAVQHIEYIKHPRVLQLEGKDQLNDEEQAFVDAETAKSDLRHRSTCYAVVGGVLGLLFGAACGFRSSFVAGILCAVLGAAAGAGAGFGGVYAATQLKPRFETDDVERTVLIWHFITLGLLSLGVTIGGTLALGKVGQTLQAALAGLVAIGIGLVLHRAIVSYFFTLENTAAYIPDEIKSRVTWGVLIGVSLFALCYKALAPPACPTGATSTGSDGNAGASPDSPST